MAPFFQHSELSALKWLAVNFEILRFVFEKTLVFEENNSKEVYFPLGCIITNDPFYNKLNSLLKL